MDNDWNELPSTPEVSAGTADHLQAGHALQQVRTSYSTAVAVQKPRKLVDVDRRLMEEATVAGEEFYYGWGSGKDRVEGASIGLAMAAARCWGNCAVEALPLEDSGDAWISTSAFVDLETGFTYARKYRQSKKSIVHGKHDAERKDEMRFAIGQSKAARNVILKALPAWLIDKAIEKAKSGVRAKIEKFIKDNGVAAAVEHLVVALAKHGVKEPHILQKFDVEGTANLTIEHLIVLRGDLKALQDGMERAEALFPLLGEEVAAKEASKRGEKPAGSKSDQLADRLAGGANAAKSDEKKAGDKPAEAASAGSVIVAQILNATTTADVAKLYDQALGPDSAQEFDLAESNAIAAARDKRLAQLKKKPADAGGAEGKDALFNKGNEQYE